MERDELIEGNLGFVQFIARKYEGAGVPLEDLVSAGRVGLVEAVQRFDRSKGKFTPYAVWWIRKRILEEIVGARLTLRLTDHEMRAMRRFDKQEAALRMKLGRAPALSELAEECAIVPEKIEGLLLMRTATQIRSLDAIAANLQRQGRNLYDVLGDPRAPDAVQCISDSEEASAVRHAIETRLTDHQAQIIELLFREDMTIKEVSDSRHVKCQGSKATRRKALKKLRGSYENREAWLRGKLRELRRKHRRSPE